ncbi:MAG: deoxyribodipyrimidine photo-lyase, partial [Rhizomicrobium sp.]|nr:deoxyribodipyrimidine photo-lyase [Rhizomicrobium sp.]
MQTTIVLFQQNLRVADNPGLARAVKRGRVVPLFIWDESTGRQPGAASRWWLREALADLQKNLSRLGTPLVIRRGAKVAVLHNLVQETGAQAVAFQRRYEPSLATEDMGTAEALRKSGVEVLLDDGYLLFDPASIRTGAGNPFRVFTPFARACLAATPPAQPIAAPDVLHGIARLESETLESLKLMPRGAVWTKGFAEAWDVRESAAQDKAADFIAQDLTCYASDRDRPDREGTSRLSPYLHFGQISPRQLWHAVQHEKVTGQAAHASIERYLLELLWREFSWHLLQQFPALAEKPLNPAFENFPWRADHASLKAWQKGLTGYPIVDAGMRQLWQTGWMHNRVRMVVASFLIKHLLIDWRAGEAWFWDTLVDADLGANAASWQWVAGCGADAAPYFRIFNPILQGQKFDPNGDYIRRYVPELAEIDTKFIHTPWLASKAMLAEAGATAYPKPIVDHGFARKRALSALAVCKGRGAP